MYRPATPWLLWLAWLAWLALAACGTTVDDRPATLPYITETLLTPTCSAATCHAAFVKPRADVFDSVSAARKSLHDNGLVSIGDTFVTGAGGFPKYPLDEAAPHEAALITWITQNNPFMQNIGRMPYDAPMPDEDVKFLEHWISIGAPGAQCVPEYGDTCILKELVSCRPDGNYGGLIADCQALGMKCKPSPDNSQPAVCGP